MAVGVEKEEKPIVQLEGVPQLYGYDELSEATRGFGEESILGRGGFGVVYKAKLKSGIQVAIKRMNQSAANTQGLKEFKSEIFVISQLSHRNLIKLRGWCADVARKEYMLVYDLLPNGSLDDLLFKSAEGTAGLPWAQKFKILTGAADGLAYLHHGFNKQVVHRDIKCSNILLDEEWNPKLGDFGIARMVDHQGRAETTDMAGTLGYIAPEVFSEYRFSEKADVFAFGVVILEVACGRRVLPSTSHKMGLVQWVQSAHREGVLLSVVDKRHRDYDTKQMRTVLKVGLLCTQSNSKDRPSMKHTVQMLAGDVKVPTIRALKPTARLFHRPPWLFSNIVKAVPDRDATDGSSLNGPTPVDVHLDAGKEFTYEEVCAATSRFYINLHLGDRVSPPVYIGTRSSLNGLNPVDRHQGAGKEFAYKELDGGTGEFNTYLDLGDRICPPAYIGTIAGNVVAVKRINARGADSVLLTDVEHMCRVRHRNLVSLLGYCKRKLFWYLVYEYIPHGTLWEALHKPGRPCMNWATRMKIAVETARGLEYLHAACQSGIIHRNLSSSNIYLDKEWGAHLSSFGRSHLSSFGLLHYRDGIDVTSGEVRGTLPYFDRDYIFSCGLAKNSHVFSFGVVLLELITGREPIDDDVPRTLVNWARPLLTDAKTTGNVDALADPNLMRKYNEKEMLRMVELAALCVCNSSEYKPNMMTVALQRLQGVRF